MSRKNHLTIATTASDSGESIDISGDTLHRHQQQHQQECMGEEISLFTTDEIISNNADSHRRGVRGDCRGVEISTAEENNEAVVSIGEEEDDITIISLDRPRNTVTHHLFLRPPAAAATDGSRNGIGGQARWILATRDATSIAHATNTSVEDEEHQLNRVLRDLERIQSYNCCHFMIWCLVPTVLLIFVLVCVYQDTKNDPICASSPGLTCTITERSYYQLFLARCKCDSVTIAESYVER
jgi:hypothetical protein